MKFVDKLLAGIFLLALTTSCNKEAQKSEEPSPVSVREFTVEGITVLYKPVQNEVVNVELFIDGGTSNYAEQQQGIEYLAIQTALENGSKNFPKDEFHALSEKKGLRLDGNAGFDYSTISLKCVTSTWDEGWGLFADLVRNPRFDEDGYAKVQQQLVSTLMQQESNPDIYLNKQALLNSFGGTGYAKNPKGLPETVRGISAVHARDYWKNLITKDRILVVVVGQLNEDDIKRKVATAFGSLPKGNFVPAPAKPLMVNKSSINYFERDIATNYIQGFMSAPESGSRESLAMKIAMSMLNERLFIEVRTKRNLSYAPAAYLADMDMPYSAVYVTTTQPNEAVKVIMNEIKKIRKAGFDLQELEFKKEGFLTEYYLQRETNGAQAKAIGKAELRGGWEFAETIMKQVNSLTLDEVNIVFAKNTNAVEWHYLGKKSVVDEQAFVSNLSQPD